MRVRGTRAQEDRRHRRGRGERRGRRVGAEVKLELQAHPRFRCSESHPRVASLVVVFYMMVVLVLR